jgi:hypothetical protein
MIRTRTQRLGRVRMRMGRPGAGDDKKTRLYYKMYKILCEEERKGKQQPGN